MTKHILTKRYNKREGHAGSVKEKGNEQDVSRTGNIQSVLILKQKCEMPPSIRNLTLTLSHSKNFCETLLLTCFETENRNNF